MANGSVAVCVFSCSHTNRVRVISLARCLSLPSKPCAARCLHCPLHTPLFAFSLGIVSCLLKYGLAFERGEFPHWAGSMSIPLIGAPVLFVLLLVWSLAHLGFLRGTNYSATPLALALSLKANWWLLCLSACTVALVLWDVVAGQYWYAIPGVIWLYFYLSIGAARRTANEV